MSGPEAATRTHAGPRLGDRAPRAPAGVARGSSARAQPQQPFVGCAAPAARDQAARGSCGARPCQLSSAGPGRAGQRRRAALQRASSLLPPRAAQPPEGGRAGPRAQRLGKEAGLGLQVQAGRPLVMLSPSEQHRALLSHSQVNKELGVCVVSRACLAVSSWASAGP
jgi:hypothetical protein